MKALLFALPCIIIACGSDEFDVPKPFSGSLPENPRTCGEVRAQGSSSASQVLIEGVPAECTGENVSCSVADLPEFSGVCLSGAPNAVCTSQRWMILCDLDSGIGTPVDGGDGG